MTEKALAAKDNSFSLIVAVLLWLFCGTIGVHRFYCRDYIVGGAILASACLFPILALMAIGAESTEVGGILLIWVCFHALVVLGDGFRLFFDSRARR